MPRILPHRSIHDEQPGACLRARAMRLGVVRDLVAHAGLERERAPIFQLGMQLAFGAQQVMTLLAPVIGEVAGRVLDHAHTDVAELPRAPVSGAALALESLT